MEKFKISLKAARVNANLTQEQVAKAVHRNKQTIVNWETGITDITFGDVLKLCELYGVPMEFIRGPENLKVQADACAHQRAKSRNAALCSFIGNSDS